jgi:antitoxin component YwqK of YwqJK toxin-antitoxin module
MQRFAILLLVCFVSYAHLSAQTDTVFNQTDSKGLKQGYWKKNYQNGHLMYKGFFKNDKPIREMRRYYEDGPLQAIMIFSEDGNTSKVRIFYQDGEPSAEGFYYGTQKDSVWKYYSFYSGALLSEEHYLRGKKNGMSRSFYDNGKVAEEIEYLNDEKNGKWNQYFDNGVVKMNSFYKQNKVNGNYIFNFPDGKIKIIGNFLDNNRNGIWTFYNEDGTEKYKLHYDKGNVNADDEKKLMEQDKEFFQKVDENIGKFADPTPEDFFRGPQ